MKAFEKEFEQVGFTASLLAVDLYNLEFVSAAINQELGQARFARIVRLPANPRI